MKGYRTIIVNVLMAVAAVSSIYGIDIPPELIEEVATGVVSAFTLVNLFLRKITTGPIGTKR